MSTKIRSCYITAPAGTNLDILRHALQHRGIRVVVPLDVALNSDLAAEIARILTNVDLVIGVLTKERRSEWVLFELGQAWATGKQILLFAPPKSGHLPSTLRRFLTVRANLSNREAIEFSLDQLLAAPARSGKAESKAQPRRILGPAADAFREDVLRTVHIPEKLESLVARALHEAGVDVLSTAPGKDEGVDLAIWSDDLQPYVGNPLLVEVKTTLRGDRQAVDAANRLSKQVASSGTLWGLLLYGEGPAAETFRASFPANVLVLSLSSLFERMRAEPFADVVRDLRNRRVHGGSI